MARDAVKCAADLGLRSTGIAAAHWHDGQIINGPGTVPPSDIFFETGLDSQVADCPSGKSLAVIPGRDKVANFDVQLHIRESITTIRGYGFRACAKWRVPE